MLITTRAIVLKSLKYGESSLICDFLTEQQGLLTGIIGGVRKAKSRNSAGLVQPSSLIDVTLYYNREKEMHRVKEYKPTHVFRHIPFEVPRIAISQFMVELIKKSVRELEQNLPLFEYCFRSILEVDRDEVELRYSAIAFALGLTRFLGFYPQNNWSEDYCYFNLLEGGFSDTYLSTVESLDLDSSQSLYRLLTIVEQEQELNFTNSERELLLDGILTYYRFHVEQFGKMNTPQIYHDIFCR